MTEAEILQGTIGAVVFQNYDNGYAVLRLNVGGGENVTVVGTIPLPAPGERLMVTGKWNNHSNYGRQFEAEFLERLLPQTSMEILSYLGSRVIKGIGPRMAARIVDRFGDQTLVIMEREPERLAEVSGISREKAKTIGKMLDEKLVLEGCFDIVLYCADQKFYTQGNGISTAKTPEGMFNDKEIPNDLKAVDTAIREYYGGEDAEG